MWIWNKQKINAAKIGTAVQDFLTNQPGSLETVTVDGTKVVAIINVTTDQAAAMNQAVPALETHIRAQNTAITAAHVVLTAVKLPAPAPEAPSTDREKPAVIDGLAKGVTHIIAVASGKGGVGKSTVAANLAVTFAQMGLKTGLLDADIYGPSVPTMMGQAGTKPDQTDKQMTPITAHGVKCMSIGFLVDTDAPMIWRGPMVQSAIVQMLRDVDWAGSDGLDVLVIDMPPGTGDAQLTIAQKLKLSGVVIVSTPQDVALIDARKGLEMFRKVGAPILGMIENMSVFCCPKCSHETAIFALGGVIRTAADLDCPVLGSIPIDIRIREQGDAGSPVVVDNTAPKITKIYRDIAEKIWAEMDQDRSKSTNENDGSPVMSVRAVS